MTIYAPNNPDEPWMTTTTDSEGRFSWLPDESIPGDWEVAIEDANQSHADYWTVPVGDKGIIYLTLASLLGWLHTVSASYWELLLGYSILPLPGHLVVVCAVAVLSLVLRQLLFY